jgi:hypothetical protein
MGEMPDAPGGGVGRTVQRSVVTKQRSAVPTMDEWQKEASGIVRSLMGRDNLRPEQVVNILQSRGVSETDRGFKEKVANGTFSLAWFLQLIVAIQRSPHLLEPELTLPPPNDSLLSSVLVQVEEQQQRHSARARAGLTKQRARVTANAKQSSDGKAQSKED